MAIQRRVNFISQQRVDVPDMRSVESAVSNDFDQLIQAFVTGTSQGYILRGFEISIVGAIGGAASGLLVQVDPGAVLHIAASQSGTVLQVPVGTANQQLNGATNPNVSGSFAPSAINYVGLDYTRYIDPTTAAQVYIWDPTTNSETTKTAPRAEILEYTLVITTTTWASNVLPIATVTTDAGNNVVSITDCRWMLFRLGQGGASPNPFYQYPWSDGRTENSSTANSTSSPSPFEGGDKQLGTLKDWMNAIMTALQEIKGTTYWYSLGSGGSVTNLREDLGNTVVTGAGSISHGVYPNVQPVLTTTGSLTVGSNQLTGLVSTTGIVAGQVILGAGVAQQATVLSIAGSTVTMSANAISSVATSTVSFYNPNTVSAAGQVNWDQPIYLDVIGSTIKYQIQANPTSAYVTLTDNQVGYINLNRDAPVSPNLIFTNSSKVVSSVGSVSWTAALQPGDWIRLAADTDSGFYQIAPVGDPTYPSGGILSLSSVGLTQVFGETSTGAGGAKAVYSYGYYYASNSPVGDPRAIQIVDRSLVPSGQNVWWFLLRQDNGGTAKVYVRFIGQELTQGDTSAIDDGVPHQLLQYIGSPMESASAPQYVSSLYPGSVAQVTSITTGDASTMTAGEYFLLYSSGSDRTYYIWVKKDGSGTDPAPNANSIGLQWNITTGQTAAQTASTLANLLNSTYSDDFTATALSSTLTVTNNSAGASNTPINISISSPFAISVTTPGSGNGNYAMQDGDSLTLAIKKLDQQLASMASAAIQPGYDETVTVVASGATPPTSINGPVSVSTQIQLPPNSRLSYIAAYYVVGSGKLEVFLNGQKLIVGADYTEVGASGANSQYISTSQTLKVGDVLEFTFGGGGGGGGGGGQQGPPGPQGPAGANGADAVGGPIAISTKSSNYSVAGSDNALLANCASGSVQFTLPVASSVTGKCFYFKKIDSSVNAMTMIVSGGGMIDGSSVISTNVQFAAFTVFCDGTQYWIF